jgi:SAM-dependent methyltransferase
VPYIGEPYDQDYFHTFSKIRPEGYHDYSRFLDFAGGQNLFVNIADDIEAQTGLVSGKRVLDVGCAYGYLTDELANRGADVTGIDISGYAMAEAQSLFPALDFVQADFLLSSLPKNEFDLTVVCGVIECMNNDAEIDAFIQEIGRVTHPTGIMYGLISYDDSDPIYQNKTAAEWEAVLNAGLPGPYDFDVQDVGHLPLFYATRMVVT